MKTAIEILSFMLAESPHKKYDCCLFRIYERIRKTGL